MPQISREITNHNSQAQKLPIPDSVHPVKISISFDYNLDSPITPVENPKVLNTKKYYVTYSIGGQLEGKVIYS